VLTTVSATTAAALRRRAAVSPCALTSRRSGQPFPTPNGCQPVLGSAHDHHLVRTHRRTPECEMASRGGPLVLAPAPCGIVFMTNNLIVLPPMSTILIAIQLDTEKPTPCTSQSSPSKASTSSTR
jgi:hypothetical protein